MAGLVTRAVLLKGGTVLFHDDQDHVQALRNTDILVRGNKIAKIGQNITAPAGAETVDCNGKIISPGFVDTHHHLWQTQLKGRHANQSVFDYIPTGFWQSHVYTADDMFWGQLGGALEAIDVGTTFVLDHAHGNQTNDHADKALAATEASGIRSIFAYSQAPYFTKWDSKSCELSRDIMPESSMGHLFKLAGGQPYGNGRVQIGFGFDYWFLPKEAVVGIFTSLRNAGIKLFTCHYSKNPTFGYNPLIHTLSSYNLLTSPSDILLSHATGLDASEKSALAAAQVPVSTTPDTEAQMGFGWPAAFTPGLRFTFGVDCHTNNTASIPAMARASLQMARQREAVADTMGDGCDAPARMHKAPVGSTEAAFNAATIGGARAVLLGDSIGSLREGKLADLVVFDAAGSPGMCCAAETDPLTAVLRHSDVRDVEAVMVDGVWRKRGGKLSAVTVGKGETLEWAAVRTKLLKSQADILERQKGLNMEKSKEALVAMFQIDESRLVEGKQSS